MTTTTIRTATDAQVGFIGRLSEQAGAERALRLLIDNFSVVSPRDLSVRDASRYIDLLKPVAQQATNTRRVLQEAQAAVDPLEPGIYQRDSDVVKVYPSQRGHLLAKVLRDSEWEYLGAAARFVTADMRMSVEQAQAFGHAFGICCCCGRMLSNDESVALGIGPICRKKWF